MPGSIILLHGKRLLTRFLRQGIPDVSSVPTDLPCILASFVLIFPEINAYTIMPLPHRKKR